MDSKFLSKEIEPGTVQCILCENVIRFYNGNQDKFFNHMEKHHNVSINKTFVLAIHFLDYDSLGQIVDNFTLDLNDIIDNGISDDIILEDEKLLEEPDHDNVEIEDSNIDDKIILPL